MKNAVPLFFLLIYSTVMLKPLMPYVTDFAAHLLFYKDHMLTVHAHNGKFHVHQEVSEAAKNEHQDNNKSLIKKDSQESDHINTAPLRTFQPGRISKYSYFPACPGQTAHVRGDFPPPRNFISLLQ